MTKEFTSLRNALVNAFPRGEVPGEIRAEVERLEGKVADLSAAKADAEASIKDADDLVADELGADHDRLAREMEPLFAAVFRGDLIAAQAVMSNLPPLLDGSDSILIAMQRAKARPHLYVAARAA